SSSRAAAVLAETRRTCQDLPPAAGGRAPGSSRTTCALVPPIPNELTPARRGAGPAGQGRSAVLTWNGLEGDSAAFGCSTCRLGRSAPRPSESAALISPATPAAVSRCPRFVLIEPIAQRAG